jgi:hypothetical protein
MTARMTSAELVALLDDVAMTVRRHVEIVEDPDPEPTRVTVTATPGDQQIRLDWAVTPESAADQITGWLPRRGGSDATNAGPWSPSVPDPPSATGRTFDKLRNGVEYPVGVRALFADGTTIEASTKATPRSPTPGPTPGPVPPGSRVLPYVGRSGLGHNSGAFVGGDDVAATKYFVDYRQSELDAYLTFVTRDKGWGPMGAIHPSWARFVRAGGIVIISIPPQPQGQRNDVTARGGNDGWWRDYGGQLRAAGLTERTVLRAGWECNGWWYDWSWGNDDGTRSAKNSPGSYVDAIRHVSDSAKTTNPGLLVSMNLNRGSRRAGHDWRTVADALTEISPVTGQRYVDILELDSYDMYPGATTEDRWQEQIRQDPGPYTVEAYCRARGVQLGYGEWGPIKAGGAGGTGGGDNPRYAHGMWDLFRRQRDILAYEIAYPHIGTNDYDHRWVNPPIKPKFSQAYLAHWRHPAPGATPAGP